MYECFYKIREGGIENYIIYKKLCKFECKIQNVTEVRECLENYQ
jgi:hypothetical protein